jgi:DedD protein
MSWAFWRQERSATPRRTQAEEGTEPEANALSEDAALVLRRRARRRLIGAAVLLLAVAIVLPMVLDPAPRPLADNVKIEMPSEKTPFTPRLALPQGDPLPAAANSDAAAPSAADSAAPAASSAATAEPAKPETSAEATQKSAASASADKAGDGTKASTASKSAPAAREATPTKPATAQVASNTATAKPGGKYLLQAAALSTEAAAQDLVARLRKSGLQPYIERVDTKGGVRFRVRVGPYATRAEAQRMQAKLRALGVLASIVPVKSTVSKPAS